MTLLPIITREMRSAARQPFTYYLRVLGAAAALGVSLMAGVSGGFEPGQGGQVFAWLHLVLLLSIWVLVPLLCADCISREKREGTLGLLFMTGLRGGEIVSAKGVVHGLRAATLWLGVLPVMTIPMLLGGVTWHQVSLSVLADFSALCLAIAAGLLASAGSRTWLQASISALGLAVFFASMVILVVWGISFPGGRVGFGWGYSFPLALMIQFGFFAPGVFPMQRATSSGSGWQLILNLCQISLVSLLVLALAIILAGRRARRSWQDRPPSLRQIWFNQTFCTPILWRSFFHRWLRRKLERNPIGWLEQRTWSGRMVTWGWFAVVISLFSGVLSDRNFVKDLADWLLLVGWLLLGSIALTAAGSFRRERETGVMELLLISPLQERQIIFGRLRGLWGQFLPSMGLLLLIWSYFLTFLPDGSGFNWIKFFASTFITLPVIGLYYSLRCRNFLTAFLSAISIGVLLPLTGAQLLFWWLDLISPYFSPPRTDYLLLPIVGQWLLAAACGWGLHHRLRHRNFPLERPQK